MFRESSKEFDGFDSKVLPYVEMKSILNRGKKKKKKEFCLRGNIRRETISFVFFFFWGSCEVHKSRRICEYWLLNLAKWENEES